MAKNKESDFGDMGCGTCLTLIALSIAIWVGIIVAGIIILIWWLK